MKGGELLSRQIKWTFINPSQIDQILDFNVRMKSKEMLQLVTILSIPVQKSMNIRSTFFLPNSNTFT